MIATLVWAGGEEADLVVVISLRRQPRWCWIESDLSTGGGKRFLGPASTRGKNGLSMTALRIGREYWALWSCRDG